MEITTGQDRKFEIDKAIFIQNESGSLNNGSFCIAFSKAILEIAQNKALTKLDVRLMMLIIGYMGDQMMMFSPNVQKLMGVQDYADDLQIDKSKISHAFKHLEEAGYIKRDKRKRDLHILINPDVAYNGRFKDFTKVWNQLALPFGNEERKHNENLKNEYQDFSSSLPRELARSKAQQKGKKEK